MLQLGKMNKLKVLKEVEFGLYLDGEIDEILIPKRYVPEGTKVGDILDKEVDSKYTISDKLWAGHQRRKKEHTAKGYGFGYSMFNEESEYTSTISARYYKDGSEILIEQEGKNPRKLTPREAARLQGFPDTYKLPVSDMQVYKQFGNSVAVPVIKALAKEIDKALKTLKQKKTSDLSNIDIDKIKADSVKTVMLNLKKEVVA